MSVASPACGHGFAFPVFDVVSGEKGVERLGTAFQLLYPASNMMSNAVNADDACDTESGEGRVIPISSSKS